MTYRQLTRNLVQLGFQFYRQAAGSHEIWWHPVSGRRTAIPNHGSKDIPKGTLARILCDLDVNPEDLA